MRILCNSCIFLVQQVTESQNNGEVFTEVVPILSLTSSFPGLKHSTNYSVRVQCTNEMGNSPFTDWVYFQTLGLGKKTVNKCLKNHWKVLSIEL